MTMMRFVCGLFVGAALGYVAAALLIDTPAEPSGTAIGPPFETWQYTPT